MNFELDFATCFEVDDALIESALAPAVSSGDPTPREKVLALIERMAGVSRPRRGAARLLVVLRALAQAGWLEGALEVWIRALGQLTEIELLLHDGLSYARLCSPLIVSAPFAEFETAIARGAESLAPLELVSGTPGEELRLHAPDRMPAPSSDMPSGALLPDEDITLKPTLRIPVTIPNEAYREDQDRPADPGSEYTETPVGPPASVPRSASTGHVELDTGDIDDSWED